MGVEGTTNNPRILNTSPGSSSNNAGESSNRVTQRTFDERVFSPIYETPEYIKKWLAEDPNISADGVIYHGDKVKLKSVLHKHTLEKNPDAYKSYKALAQPVENAIAAGNPLLIKQALDKLTDAYFRAPGLHEVWSDAYVDVIRSAQKDALRLFDKCFKDLTKDHQTEVLKKFVGTQMEHLLFHETTERDAVRRGIDTLTTALSDMKDKVEGRTQVNTELFKTIRRLDKGKHSGIKNKHLGRTHQVFGHLVFWSTLPTIVIPLFVGLPWIEYGKIKASKESKNQNEGVSLATRERVHVRDVWPDLNTQTKKEYLDHYNAMRDALARESGSGKKIRNLSHSYRYHDPNNFDRFWTKKNGTAKQRYDIWLAESTKWMHGTDRAIPDL